MRVTNQVLIRNFLHHVEARRGRMRDLQEQLASGQRITRPSQDPAGTALSMRLGTTMVEVEQYLRNIDDARGWLEQAESTLLDAIETLHRATELVIQGRNETLGPDERRGIGAELQQLAQHLLDLANTRHGGSYLFSGHQTETRPFPTLEDYAGDAAVIWRDIGPGIRLAVNYGGEEVFGGDEGLLRAVHQVAGNMASNEVDLLDEGLTKLQNQLGQLLARVADLGGRVKRLDCVEQRLGDTLINAARLRSRMVDADLAEAVINLRSQEAAYQAALSAGARILQISLLDYLR